MEVLKITPRGYCHGVVDAFRIAKRVREETTGPVHMLGMLVHNTHATDDLQRQGVELVDQNDRLAGLSQIKGGTVIFSVRMSWWRTSRARAMRWCTSAGRATPSPRV